MHHRETICTCEIRLPNSKSSYALGIVDLFWTELRMFLKQWAEYPMHGPIAL
jgi:hypothetical protein